MMDHFEIEKHSQHLDRRKEELTFKAELMQKEIASCTRDTEQLTGSLCRATEALASAQTASCELTANLQVRSTHLRETI